VLDDEKTEGEFLRKDKRETKVDYEGGGKAEINEG